MASTTLKQFRTMTSTTLKQFRDYFPRFRPDAICEHRNGTLLEVVSWPYLEHGERASAQNPVLIKARTPNDPTTIATYRISGENPDLQGFIPK